ncbi:MAG: putative DNA binding domain-containing protein [Bacteroidaceae bacterium]|nr:putative DNA binding domain-containing protein [Bacteroidaceae bacterium]
MTIEDIEQLISKDEHRALELKKTTGELKEGMHTACALLNTDGGWLIFGIAPCSLKIIGQEVTAIYFEPFVWGRQPYTYHGCPYYKIESTTKVMPRDMFEERIRANKPQYFAWERQQAERVSIKNLNEERVRGAIRLGVERGRMMESALTEPFEKVLDKLQLLNNGVPNNAAAALFSTNIYEYPQFRLRMARFRGTDKNEFIDNQRAEGNFFDLLDAGMSFFFKHLSLSGKIVGFVREEHLEVPAEALREALINALCHRQYEKYNLTIGIAIYDDRIEIESPGILPPQLTPETIKLPHISYPYNPIMANVLFKTTFLENWGSGAKRIMDACKQQNVPEPMWSTQGGFVIVTFRRVLKDTSIPQVPPNLSQTCLELAQNLPSQVKNLIITINTLSLSKKEMLGLGKLPCKSRETLEQNFLSPAIDKGLVTMQYPESPKHPLQKYRLTEKGLEILKFLI